MTFVTADVLVERERELETLRAGPDRACAGEGTLLLVEGGSPRMVKLGMASWYLPRWLGRVLPRINVEGAGYFDTPAAARQTEPGITERASA